VSGGYTSCFKNLQFSTISPFKFLAPLITLFKVNFEFLDSIYIVRFTNAITKKNLRFERKISNLALNSITRKILLNFLIKFVEMDLK